MDLTFLVDITLYTGQHMHCTAETKARASSLAHGFCSNTMVELAIVIDTRTGEVVYEQTNLAAAHRIH